MHAVFVACLFGGGLATALFAILGRVGGHAGHTGGHAHAGHGHVHGSPGHALPGHAHGGGSSHGHVTTGTHGHVAPAQSDSQVAHPHAGQHGMKSSGYPQSGHGWLSSSVGWTLSWFSPLTVAAAALWFGAVGLIAEGPLGSIALLVAIVAAIMGAALVRSIMGAFVRAGTPPLQLTGEGAIATVNATIRPDSPGEVIYTLEGLHRSAPARSEDGSTIPRGAAVVIVRREGGFAWVESMDPLSALETGSPPPLPEEQPANTELEGPQHEAADRT